jgi:hypothetical protein
MITVHRLVSPVVEPTACLVRLAYKRWLAGGSVSAGGSGWCISAGGTVPFTGLYLQL